LSAISTHVLDLAHGRPAAGVPVRLEILQQPAGWVTLVEALTNADGRAKDLVAGGSKLDEGVYRLTFLTGRYYAEHNVRCFHPEVAVVFEVHDGSERFHVPLLLSPWGYSTYRGS
jgi:5-hydroxyisourate hydrolase